MCQNDPERTSLPLWTSSLPQLFIRAVLWVSGTLPSRPLVVHGSIRWNKGSVSRAHPGAYGFNTFVTNEDLLPQGSAETAFSGEKQVWNYCRNSGRMCLTASLQGLILGPGIARLSGVVTSSSETRGEIFQVVPMSSQAILWGVLTAPPPWDTQSVSTRWAAASHFVLLWRKWALKQQRNCPLLLTISSQNPSLNSRFEFSHRWFTSSSPESPHLKTEFPCGHF